MYNIHIIKINNVIIIIERVAIKIIDRGNLDTKTAKMLLREISVMSSCNHPSLVRYEVVKSLFSI